MTLRIAEEARATAGFRQLLMRAMLTTAVVFGVTSYGKDIDGVLAYLKAYEPSIPERVVEDLDSIDALVGRQDRLAKERLQAYDGTNVARAMYLQSLLIEGAASNELLKKAAMLGYGPAFQALGQRLIEAGDFEEAAVWTRLAQATGFPVESPVGPGDVDRKSVERQLVKRARAIREHIGNHPVSVGSLEAKLAADDSTDEDDWMRILTTEAE